MEKIEKTDRITQGMAYRQHLLDKLSVTAGEAETCRPDHGKENYTQSLEKRLSDLGSILKDIAETGNLRERGFEFEIDEDMKVLRDRLHAVKKGVEQLKTSGGDAWQELGKGVSGALDEITAGIKAAVKKIK